MDAVSEQRLANVFPPLADKIRQMADILAKQNIYIRVTQGVRTVAEQQALYDQGRKTPGKIVTNCPGGHSWHNYGLAVDVVPGIVGESTFNTFAPDWNSSHPVWIMMEKTGTGLGLDSGAFWRTFKDYPHFQLTGRFPEGAPNDEAMTISDHGVNLKPLWNAVQMSLPGPIQLPESVNQEQDPEC